MTIKMAIISKLDRTREAYEASVAILQAALTTQRASSQTRQELAEAREFARDTCTCYYCGEHFTVDNVSPRHVEACKKCGKLLDSLMQRKSKIVAGSTDIDHIKALHKVYTTCPFVHKLPGALRGATGDIVDIVKALEPVFDTYAKYRVEIKAASARSAAEYLENKRRSDILAMLVQCGADPDAEETKQRVDEIYWDRYADEHL